MQTCVTCGLPSATITLTRTINGIPQKENYCADCYTKTEFYLMMRGTKHGIADQSRQPSLFETDLQKIIQSAGAFPDREKFPDPTSNLTIPPEISRIRTGSIQYFAGAFINDGLINWLAFDADRHLSISVNGLAGPQLKRLPKLETLRPNQCLRYTDAAGYKRAEVVTIVEATPEEVQEFALLANPLLKKHPEKPPFHRMSDTLAYSFDLLSEGKKIPVIRGKEETHLQTFIGELLQRDSYRTTEVRIPLRFCGLALDASGNMYTSFNNHTIWKVTPDGIASHWAGQSYRTGSRDGVGSSARFDFPTGLVVDDSNNVYVADQSNNVIRRITPQGVVSTYAGIPESKGTEDGPRATARIDRPRNVALDRDNNLYVSTSYTIRKVNPDGLVTTLAGTPKKWDMTEHECAQCPVFSAPTEIALDSKNAIYVVDSGNHRIRIISQEGNVRTLTWREHEGKNTPIDIKYPYFIAIDSHDNIFIYQWYAFYKITPEGYISIFAGAANDKGLKSHKGEGYLDGNGVEARFGEIGGVAIDRIDNLYVADSGSLALRRITPDGVVSTLFSFDRKAVQTSSMPPV